MADTLKPVPAKGLHIRNVDPTTHQFQAAVSRDGFILYIPHVPFLVKNFLRGIHHRYNRLRTALWPIPPAGAIGAVLGFVGWVVSRPSESWWRSGRIATALWNLDASLPLADRLPTPVRVTYLSLVTMAVVLGVLVESQRAFLRTMLGYTGWLFEDPRKPSLVTKVWYFIVKCCYVRSAKPLLWSYQDGLPHLPVPPLKATTEKTLVSLEPVLSKEDFETLKEKGAAFLANEGPVLQRYLILKSWLALNYVSDWWLRFVYLRGRGSLLIHSNYFGCGDVWPLQPITTNREARAASLVHQYIMRKQEIDHETLQPLRINDVIPLCMDQYKYMFSCTRIPGLECDYLQQYEPAESRHIVVLHAGVYYRINVYTMDRRLITAYELQILLRSIVENPMPLESPAEGQLAALTSENRSKWAEVREQHFYRGLNKSSLDIIERAIMILILDDHSPANLSEQATSLLAGDGTNRWSDKSFCLVIFKNGRAGMHAEHSWGDAPVVSHLTEICLAREIEAMKKGTLTFDAEGRILPPPVKGPQKAVSERLTMAQHLRWQMNPELEQAIQSAVVQAKANIEDLDLESNVFEDVNRGLIKACKTPPDAFVQMALQLTYYRMEKRFVATYEPAMMRMWRNGRTETIRSCSKHSCAWVLAMEDAAATKEQRRKLLKVAAEDHQYRTKLSMAGKGIDRHLFALYVVSRGKEVNSPFLEQVLGMKWTLSTSQVPWRQANKSDIPGIDWSRVMISSGGFGPVDQDGYGCCYSFQDDKYLLMHVSSRKSATHTDSKKFMAALTQSLQDMVAICKE